MKKNQLSIPFVLIAIALTTLLLSSCQKDTMQGAKGPASAGRGGGGDATPFDSYNTCTSCQIKYPDNSNLPRSSVAFNESDVLAASEPGPSTCSINPTEIKLWYSDEHPITLGVRQVIVKTSTGTTTTNYAISPSTTAAKSMLNPLLGSTIESGDQAGNDVAAGGGRPLWPVLYVTDITGDDSTSRAGDWQQGGSGYAPSEINGMWKSCVKTIDKTKNPNVVTITTDADPSTKNGWNLASGDAPPTGTQNDGYGAEIVWKVSDLGLKAKHKYRIQFMVHDGDQNKAGGDVGEACITVIMPDNNRGNN